MKSGINNNSGITKIESNLETFAKPQTSFSQIIISVINDLAAYIIALIAIYLIKTLKNLD